MSVWQDVRFGARTLLKSPGFAVTAVITMAVGIGVTTSIFSVCDAMLWKPIPLPHLETLATIVERVPGDVNDFNQTTPADTDDIRAQSSAFAGMAEWQTGLANIAASRVEPDRALQALVSANFFSMAGVQPSRGRAFRPGEDQPGHESEVILSDSFWRRRFGADAGIVGTVIHVDDKPCTVIGIMPARFEFPLATDIWTPLALKPAERASRDFQELSIMARLKPGMSITQAAAEVDAIAGRLAAAHPETNRNRRFQTWPLLRLMVDYETRQYLTLLLCSVLFVLLIACVNVANLQFARATGRLREVAVRRALGAGRWRVTTQLVTESILLCLAGAALGLLIAKWGVNAMRIGMPPEVARYVLGWNDMSLDGRALAFTLAAALVSGIVAGLAPAWQSSGTNLVSTLREGGRGSSAGGSHKRLRNLLVGAEVAMAVVLLVGAGLMVRGFRAMLNNGAALDPSTLLTLRLTLTENKYGDKSHRAEFYRQVLDRIRALPGAISAAAVSALPYSNHSNNRQFAIEGRQVERGNEPHGMYQAASAGYFEMMHIPLKQGRLLSASDGASAPKVAVVSEHMAQRWWPNDSPIGRHIRTGTPGSEGPWLTIVGVAGDVAQNAYDREPRRLIYVPLEQDPPLWMDIGVRTAGDPLRLAPAVSAAIRSVDSEQPITELRTMERQIHDRAIGMNYVAVLMAVFGGVALLLSAVGVYGVMAYLVSEQTRDIGIRMALGAQQANVLGMVFRHGLTVTGVGLAVGLVLAFGFARLIASLVYGVSATDPATFVGIPLSLLAATALAIYVPARRAMKIDPIVALRYE